jgi:hypothetical protein
MMAPFGARTNSLIRRTAAALAAAATLGVAGSRGRAERLSWQNLPFSGLPIPLHSEWPSGSWRPAWALEIRNSNGGAVLLYRDGHPQRILGRVIKPARRMAASEFYAGYYGRGGTVIASSRKTLRLRGPGPVATDRIGIGRLRKFPVVSLSLLPRDWALGFESPAERKAIQTQAPEARTFIWTDSTTELFGEWAPPVGSPVFYSDGSGWRPLSEMKQPQGEEVKAPERLLVVVFRPQRRPRYLELENWTADTLRTWKQQSRPTVTPPDSIPIHDGRAVAAWDEAGRDISVFGSVYQRVQAVGRLDDTGIAKQGQICTIHPGDVAISTSLGLPRPIQRHEESEALSGFQIVPANHARDGMVDDRGHPGYAIGHGVWMIVGPEQSGTGNALLRRLIGDQDFRIVPELEGTAPLFAGYLSPRYFAAEDTGNAVPIERRGYLVRISSDFGRTWTRLPSLRATAPCRLDGLKRVTHVRLYLPTGADQ